MNSARKIMSKPCVLINKLNVRKKRIWLVEHPEKNAVSSTEFVPLTSTMMSLGYLNYVALTDRFTNYMLNCSSGSSNSQKRVTPDDIMDYVITVPSLLEQVRVASFLETIDSKIQAQQDLIELLKKYKRGLLQNIFPRKDETVPRLRLAGFTGDWEQHKLCELINVCSGRDYKHLSEGIIPVYGTGGYMLSVSEALSYNKDAIGIGRKGTIDKPYILKAPFWTVDTLFYAIPRKKVDLNFVFGIFQNINWKKKDESTGVPSLSKASINDVDIVTPEYTEQKVLGRLFSNFDHLITLHQRKLETIQKIRIGLLQQLFI